MLKNEKWKIYTNNDFIQKSINEVVLSVYYLHCEINIIFLTMFLSLLVDLEVELVWPGRKLVELF